MLESDQSHSFLQDNYSENCEENCQFKGKVKKLKSVQSSGTTNQIQTSHGYQMRNQQPKTVGTKIMQKNISPSTLN